MFSNSGDGVEMTVTRDPGKQVNDEYFMAIRFWFLENFITGLKLAHRYTGLVYSV